MRCAIVLVCAGMAAATYIVDVARALSLSQFALLLLFCLLLLSQGFQAEGSVRRLLIASVLFLCGVCWHLHWASHRLESRLPVSLEGETIELVGVVIGLPSRSAIAQQFQFKVLQTPSGFYPRKVVLNYYGEEQIEPGQYWRLAVRLNRPHGFSNPGGFDYEAWLMQQGISARGYVRDSATNELLIEHGARRFVSPTVWLHAVRHSLKRRLQQLLADSQYGGLLIALLLGDRSGITQDHWQLFTATGSNHLFVISGLHIGMISGFAFWLMLNAAKLLGVAKFIPAQKFAAFFALAAALSYALLAGFSLPTQRAFIMIAVLLCGLFGNTRYLISFRLLLAAFLVLLLNPLAIVSSGFFLSFVAVAALLSFAGVFRSAGTAYLQESSWREQWISKSELLVRPQIIVFTALIAPLVFFTQQLSLLAPVVNIVAIPVVGFLLVPICFIAVLASYLYLPAASALLGFAHGIITLLLHLMQLLVDWGAGVLQLQIPQPNTLHLLALFSAALILLLPRGVCRRSLVLPLLLFILPLPDFLRARDPADASLRLHVLDVGQGLAVIVETAEHVLLYDTGANLSPDFNIGSAVVVPALRALGIRSLDAVVVSHGDNDHAGGLRGIEPHMEITRLIHNRDGLSAALPVELCTNTNAWNWDGVEFRFLRSGLVSDSENNDSCVLQIRRGATSILLPGDIEREVELELARRYGSELNSGLLLAPHHGSLTSSSYAFLKRVSPDVVVYSAGYRNSFGHPHERIVARYREFGSGAFNTAASGMISFAYSQNSSGGDGIAEIQQYRKQNLRYWR